MAVVFFGPAHAGSDPVREFAQTLLPADQAVRFEPPADRDAVVLRDRAGVTLRSLRIRDEVSIVLENCRDITIVSCDLRSVRATNVTGLRVYNSKIHRSPHNAVSLDGCNDVVVQGNLIQDVATGVYAHRCTQVQVVGNLCFDVKGPFPRGQLAQFDKVTGPGNVILANIAVNRHGRSNPEDVINLYQSVGTPDSPIRVEHNFLAGDPEVGSQDLSPSGSGIMLGDGGGQHQIARHNTLVSPGQAGIGVAGGGDIQVVGNTVFGGRSNVANVGLYTWNQYPDAPAGAVTVTGNRIRWTNAEGRSNPHWDGGGFTGVTEHHNVFGDAGLNTKALTPDLTSALPPVPHGQEAVYPFPVQ